MGFSKQSTKLFTYMEDADFYAAYIGGIGFTKADEPTAEDEELAKLLTGAYSKNEEKIASFILKHIPFANIKKEELLQRLGTPEIDIQKGNQFELTYAQQDVLAEQIFTLKFTGIYENLRDFRFSTF